MIDRDDIKLWLEVFGIVVVTFAVIIGWIAGMYLLVAGGHIILMLLWFVGVPAAVIATAVVW